MCIYVYMRVMKDGVLNRGINVSVAALEPGALH